MKTVGFFAAGHAVIGHLDRVLEAKVKYCPSFYPTQHLDAVAGWGYKPSSKRAMAYAAKHNLPYWALEDGFLRSIGLGVHGHLEHSFIVDPVGVYYDATKPSLLENLIIHAPQDTDSLERANRCIDMLRQTRLSKYNLAPEVSIVSQPEKPSVLVVDQTYGDASVCLGMASATQFEEMLKAAIHDNPGAEVLVKVHPDVLAGKKKGYLHELAKVYSCRLVAQEVNPWSLFERVSDVYVVTSQLGFEALLAGKRVHCFGIPFYAGWGLTQDRQQCDRRQQSRSLQQLFCAAYLQYCRYINPYTGERCAFEDTVALLSLQKQHLERLRGAWLLPKNQRTLLPRLNRVLGLAADIRATFEDENRCDDRLVLVNSYQLQDITEASRVVKIQALDLFSVGPFKGVGYGLSNSVELVNALLNESALLDLLDQYDLSPHEQDVASGICTLYRRYLQQQISATYTCSFQLPKDRKILLVVEDREQLSAEDELVLLNLIRESNPTAYIVYARKDWNADKFAICPLPSVCDRGLAYDDILPFVQWVDEVHTHSSLMGFKALVLSVPVVTYSDAFYAGWGLTEDNMLSMKRARCLTLEELVYMLLIKYVTYHDPDTGDVINFETAHLLAQRYAHYPYGLTLASRIKRVIRSIFLNT